MDSFVMLQRFVMLLVLCSIGICTTKGECIEGNVRFKESSAWRRDSCTNCSCRNSVIRCQRETCKDPHCDITRGESLIIKPNSCCPECTTTRKRQCEHNGEIIAHNTRWNEGNCTDCLCSDGAISCRPMTCNQNLDCGYGEELWKPDGECCSRCVSIGKTCSFNGKTYRDGDVWSPTICERARCSKGEIIFQIATCDPVVCSPGERLIRAPDQCCPRCVGAVCEIEGFQYNSGEHFQLDACRHCTCHNGDVKCNTKDCDLIDDVTLDSKTGLCPVGTTRQSKPNKCCPECVSTKAHCDYNGVRHYHGEAWESNNCQACACNEGSVTCSALQCSPIKCKRNEKRVHKPGHCCPECVRVTSQCRYKDLFYIHGDEWQIGACERCACMHGVTQCFTADCAPCPEHTVPVPIPGECCPSCEPVTCHGDCATCYGPSYGQCKTCKNSRHLLQEGKCVRRCLPGFYQEGSICKRCHDSCETCQFADSPSACTSCRPPLQLQDGSCVEDCIQGYYDDAGLCKKCSRGCKRCLSASVCVECRNRTMLVEEGGCVESCRDGHYYAHDMCKPCHPSCATCSRSSDICDTCPAHRLKQNNLCVTECAQRFYKSSEKTCKECHPSCSSCAGPTESQCSSCLGTKNLHEGKCVDHCPPGFYPELGICRACHSTCQSCVGSSASDCTACQSNSRVIEPTTPQSSFGKCVNQCSKGRYLDNKICQVCHDSCADCDGPTNSNCSSCGENQYLLMTSQSKRMCLSEEECWVLSLSADVTTNQCLNKEELAQCNKMRRSLDLTLNGNDDLDVEKCVKTCPKGTFKMDTSMGSICARCGRGCASCSSGDECVECSDGYMLSVLTSQCVVSCEDGFYQSRSGQCQHCPSNCLTCGMESGQVRCSSCRNGNYVLQFGECVASCGDQFYADVEAGGLGTPLCRECDWSCNRCSGPANDQCLECMTGAKLQDGKCVDQCGAGYYESSGKCLPCSAGSCSSCRSVDTCDACARPFHLHENKCVSSCPRGFVADPINNKCVPCPAHCLLCSTPTTCSQCDTETFMSKNEFNEGATICGLACPSGFFGNELTRQCQFDSAGPVISIVKSIIVTMGEKSLIDERIIKIRDDDSNVEQLQIFLEMEPGNGWIEVDHIRVRTGGSIPAIKVIQGRVWFTHDGLHNGPGLIVMRCTDGHLQSSSSHIDIHVVSSSPPEVIRNKMLIVSSGETTRISPQNIFDAEDQDNPEDVSVVLLSSPKFGHIISSTEVEIEKFSLTDLHSGDLQYSADTDLDSSEPLYDVLNMQITDGYYIVNAAVRVHIIPKKSSQASLVNNQEAHVRANGLLQITSSMLQTVAENEKDKSKLVYVLLPGNFTNGEVVRITPMSSDDPTVNQGNWVQQDIHRSPPLTRFSQQEIDNGNVWYRDLSGRFNKESLNFKVIDESYKPPQMVANDVFHISVIPQNSESPRVARGIKFPPHMSVDREQITILHNGYMRYTDDDTPDSELIYNITRPIYPYFGTIEHSDHPYVPISVFTQSDIDSNKIIYRPPYHESPDITDEVIMDDYDGMETDEYDDTMETDEYDDYPYYDYGRYEALTLETRDMPEALNFEYTVSDGHHTLKPSVFTIDVKDQVASSGPTFTIPLPRLDVTQGGMAPIGSQQLAVTDPDTDSRDLIFTLVKRPRHGSLITNDQGTKIMLHEGDSFTHDEIQRNALIYVHDGSTDEEIDQLQISVTDITHTAAKVIQVFIQQINQASPYPDYSSELSLVVNKGSETILQRQNLAYADDDSTDAQITFHVLSKLQHGILDNELVGDILPGDSFTQEDLNSGYIRYRSKESSGSQPQTDRLQFYVTDKIGNKLDNQVLTITVISGDNQPPMVSVGYYLEVEEGGSAIITPREIMITDVDSPKTELVVKMTRRPINGYFLNTQNNDYFLDLENDDMSFTMQEILDGAIYYVQSLHRHSEPTSDFVRFYVTDGKNKSPTYSLNITILPTNDEEPEVRTSAIVCKSGHATMILSSSLSVLDEDTSPRDLVFEVTSLPSHGSLVRFSEKMSESSIAKWKMMGNNSLQLDLMESKKLTKLRVGSTFTFQDVLDKLICFESEGYSVPNAVHRHRREALGFVVSDGQHEKTGSVNIEVEPTISVEEFRDFQGDEMDEVEFGDELISEVVIPSMSAPVIEANTGINVEKGTTTFITRDNLQASEPDSPGSSPRFVVVREPAIGYLQLAKNLFAVNITSGGESVFMQQDIDEGMLKYIHPQGQPGGQFSFKFNVVGASGSTLPEQTFHISVKDDRKPPVIRINKGLKVKEDESKKITTDSLSATDEVTSEQLIYTITERPTLGQLELITRPGHSIRSFTQSDLEANRVVYDHTSDREDLLEDKFTFALSDGNNQIIESFVITIEPVDNSLPHLENGGIRVQEGIRKTITEFELKATDADTKDALIKFKILRAPEFGTIERENHRGRHSPVKSFTMEDIIQSKISYNHDGSNSVEDSFTFTVGDGTNPNFITNEDGKEVTTKEPQTFNIVILPVDDGTPRLVVNTGIKHLEYSEEKAVGTITKSELFTEDPDTTPDKITYTLTSNPRHGRIESTSKVGTPIKSFTQADIDAGNIRYVLTPSKIAETRDSFMFNVRDSMPNVVTGNIFHIRWSVFEIDQQSYTVREEDGHVDVVIRRRGSPDYAIVLCRTEAGTATSVVSNDPSSMDYTEFASQVQFDEHEDEQICSIKINEDSIYEGEERFTVQLAMPNYALLGEITETTVIIDDSNDKPTMEFENEEYEVNEEDDNIFVPIVRTGDVDKTVTVICFTESGTATGSTSAGILPGSDYKTRDQTSSTSEITFAPGVTKATCDVKLVDDRMYEESEKFFVKLRNPSTGARVGDQWNASITIRGPNDQPSLYFSESRYEFTESQATVDVTVVRSGADLSQTADVWCSTRAADPLSAKPGEDFVQSSNKVSFRNGEKSKICSMSIIDDSQIPSLEGRETFEVYLSSEHQAKLAEPHVAIVTINDTMDDIPTMQFVKTEMEVKETDKFVSVVIKRTGDVSGTSSVICYTKMGSAAFEEDFDERANTETSRVVFKPGQELAVCNVTIVDDTIYESTERFSVHLSEANGDKWYGSVVGEKDEATITITNNEDEPTISFERTEYSIREPDTDKEIREFVIKVVRTGDTSEVSKVRCSTRDGSATASVDYEPRSKMLRFQPGESEILFTVDILSNEDIEWHETFLVVLGPEDPVNAVLGARSQATVTILDRNSAGSLVLPTTPVVVSLMNYDDVKTGLTIDPSAGYPLICVTPCDPHYPDYVDTRNLCEEAGINASAIAYSWEVAMPTNVKGGGSNPFVRIQDNTPFTSVDTKVLDSIYFSRRFHVRCVAQAVDSNTGNGGTPLRSNVVTIGTENGMCHKPIAVGAERGFQAESFIAKLKYIPPTEKENPNSLEISVEIPHQDGRLPLISTMPFNNLKLILAQSIDRQQHVCSNMMYSDKTIHISPDDFDVDEKELGKYLGFIDPTDYSTISLGPGYDNPYQLDPTVREQKTIDLYKYLNLKSCVWRFTAHYKMNQLIDYCNGKVEQDYQLRDASKSLVTVSVPLHVSYVYVTAPTGWGSLEHRTEMQFSFVYDNVVWTGGVQTEGSHSARLRINKMRIREDGRLEIKFETKVQFRGMFVLEHRTLPNKKTTIISPEDMNVEFIMENVWNENTFDSPRQEWKAVSKYSRKDYSGDYEIQMLPCTVDSTVQWKPTLEGSEPACTAFRPEKFKIPITFQQTNRPVPVVYSLNTAFQLGNNEEMFLQDPNKNQNLDYKGSFTKGQTIYGKVLWNPDQNLESSYQLRLEKVYLCTGKDGYIPTYDPQGSTYLEGPQFGCIRPSKNLQHRFLLLDRENRDAEEKFFHDVPFEAYFAADQTKYSKMLHLPGVDGFSINVDALYKVEAGHQWYIQVIYGIGSEEAMRSRSRRSVLYAAGGRRRRAVDEDFASALKNGTNMRGILVEAEKDLPAVVIAVITLAAIIPFLVCCCCFVLCARRRRKKEKKEPKKSIVVAEYRDQLVKKCIDEDDVASDETCPLSGGHKRSGSNGLATVISVSKKEKNHKNRNDVNLNINDVELQPLKGSEKHSNQVSVRSFAKVSSKKKNIPIVNNLRQNNEDDGTEV